MTREELSSAIRKKKSFLCVGLDTDTGKIPQIVRDLDDPIFEFNKRIIDATLPYAVAYKPNLAFYEAHGSKGWDSLRKTLDYMPPGIFKIADAKRGDIGNTAAMYAKAFFEDLGFDAITLSPYMGRDSIEPFLKYDDKWVIILALTSNKGSEDFQQLPVDGKALYKHVLQTSATWGNSDNIMFVVGATKSEYLKSVREMLPEHFLLVPGVGAQGGSLKAVAEFGLNKKGGLLINASRSILYASDKKDFAEAAAQAASALQQEMELLLANHRIST